MPCRSNFFGSTILGRSGIINIGRSSIRSFSLGGSSINFSTFSSDVIVERIEVLCLSTVEVEPPVADEVVLVEDGSVGAEEAVLGQTSSSISCADMEHLTLRLFIRVIASINLTVTRKGSFRGFREDRVVLAGDSGNSVHQHFKGVGFFSTSNITGSSIKLIISSIAVKRGISFNGNIIRCSGCKVSSVNI